MSIKLQSKPLPARMRSALAAEYLGVPDSWLVQDRFSHRHNGTELKVPYLKMARSVYYQKADLDAFLESCRVE